MEFSQPVTIMPDNRKYFMCRSDIITRFDVAGYNIYVKKFTNNFQKTVLNKSATHDLYAVTVHGTLKFERSPVFSFPISSRERLLCVIIFQAIDPS